MKALLVTWFVMSLLAYLILGGPIGGCILGGAFGAAIYRHDWWGREKTEQDKFEERGYYGPPQND